MNKERLLLLADKLDSLDTERYKFSLQSWGEFERFDVPDEITDRINADKTFTTKNVNRETLADCGTVCCAVGWACTMSEFQAEGLYATARLIWLYSGECYCEFEPVYEKEGLKPETGWKAVTSFFDITPREANMLFDVEFYDEDPTPKEVADRIRELVAEEVEE